MERKRQKTLLSLIKSLITRMYPCMVDVCSEISGVLQAIRSYFQNSKGLESETSTILWEEKNKAH